MTLPSPNRDDCYCLYITYCIVLGIYATREEIACWKFLITHEVSEANEMSRPFGLGCRLAFVRGRWVCVSFPDIGSGLLTFKGLKGVVAAL